MPLIWAGLMLAFASALVTNTAYSLEHDAAAALPPLSPRRPFRSVQMLLGDRRWLAAFVLFGETLPSGMRAVLQVASFACLVARAVALGRQQAPQASEPDPRTDRTGQGPQSAQPGL